MIKITRFDHTELTVNADLIETIEAAPDTHITLVTGKKLLARENTEEIIGRVIEFRRACGASPGRPPVTEAYRTDAEEE